MPRFHLSCMLLASLVVLPGCGGSGTTDVAALLSEFRRDEATAKQKYAGKPVRIKVSTINKISDAGNGQAFIDGRVGKITIWAFTADKAEAEKALAHPATSPILIEGEIDSYMSTGPSLGLFQLKSTKVVP